MGASPPLSGPTLSDRPIGRIYRSPERRHPGSLEIAREIGVATIAAAMGEDGRAGVVAADQLRRIAGVGVVAGFAVTVWNPPGNNTMVRHGVELCGPGDVLVVTTPSDGAAQWGELASEWAKAVGAAGALVDGSVRDVASVREIGLPVWGRTIDPRQALKALPGYVNAPVIVGGVRIVPGDLVVGDDDGIVVVRADRIASVVALARARADREARVRSDLRQGRAPRSWPLPPGTEMVDTPWSDDLPTLPEDRRAAST